MGLAWQQGPLAPGAIGRFLVSDPLPERLLYADAETTRPLALYESGFAPRWYVPRADVNESALTAATGQTFCPYKGLASYYDIGDAHRAAWSYKGGWPEARRISRLISFEPDKIEVYLQS